MRTRTYLTSGQKAEALADADAPNVPDVVADGAIEDDGVVDAVLLPVRVRDDVRLAVGVLERVTLIEPERVTVSVFEAVRDTVTENEVDMLRDAVAPVVSEPVDVDVCVAVSELDGVVETEMEYEGDTAHHAGIDG